MGFLRDFLKPVVEQLGMLLLTVLVIIGALIIGLFIISYFDL
jgi:hypothetical protein